MSTKEDRLLQGIGGTDCLEGSIGTGEDLAEHEIARAAHHIPSRTENPPIIEPWNGGRYDGWNEIGKPPRGTGGERETVDRPRLLETLKCLARARLRSMIFRFVGQKSASVVEEEIFLATESELEHGIKNVTIQLGFGDHIFAVIRGMEEYINLQYNGDNMEALLQQACENIDNRVDAMEAGDASRSFDFELFDEIVEDGIDAMDEYRSKKSE